MENPKQKKSKENNNQRKQTIIIKKTVLDNASIFATNGKFKLLFLVDSA